MKCKKMKISEISVASCGYIDYIGYMVLTKFQIKTAGGSKIDYFGDGIHLKTIKNETLSILLKKLTETKIIDSRTKTLQIFFLYLKMH